MIEATQATLPGILAAAKGGERLRLAGDFAGVVVDGDYPVPIAIEAAGAVVAGLVLSGRGIVWRGGTIRASGGYEGVARAGYGVTATGRDITIEGARIIESNRGIAATNAIGLAVRYCEFELGQDGIIAAGGRDLEVSYCRFTGVKMMPTRCTLPGGLVTEGGSKAACTARGGRWVDGWHQDPIQLRNGIVGVRIIGNVVRNTQQGIGEMSAPTDAGLEDVLIDGNDVEITGAHSITIEAKSSGVTMVRNRVRQVTGKKTVLRYPAGTVLADNLVLK